MNINVLIPFYFTFLLVLFVSGDWIFENLLVKIAGKSLVQRKEKVSFVGGKSWFDGGKSSLVLESVVIHVLQDFWLYTHVVYNRFFLYSTRLISSNLLF